MIVVAGEALVDLAPADDLLAPLPGGSPYNVAVGLGRQGRTVGFVGPLSADGFGRILAQRLEDEQVDLALAPRVAAPTTLAVVHLDDQGRAGYAFYLDGTSAAGLTEVDLPALPVGAALHVSFGAVTLDTAPAGATLAALLTAHRGRGLVSLDPNVRPSVIRDLAGYAGRMEALVAGCDLVKVSDEDLTALHPDRDPLDVATGWAGSGPALVVVTRGPAGATALRPEAGGVAVPGEAVEVVDTVGAGDAFTAGLLAWLDAHDRRDRAALTALSDDDLGAALRHAVHVAALTCTRAGADPPRLAP